MHINSRQAIVLGVMILSHGRRMILGTHQAVLMIVNVELSMYRSLCMNGLLNVHFFSVEFSFLFSFSPPKSILNVLLKEVFVSW